MLGDIVSKLMTLIGTHPDLEVVDRITDRGALATHAASHQPDVVLLELGEEELPQDCLLWFRAHPHVRVLAVTSSGRDLTELRCVRDDVSPDELLTAIRDVPRPPMS